MTNALKRTATAVTTALLLGGGGTALASSHAEAPFIKTRPPLDASDFYLFRSYEPGREHYVTLIANYYPLQDAYGGPNYFAMNPEAIYEFHIDNDGDAVEDLSFLFDFDNGLRNAEQGLALQIGDQSVPVPLKHIGPLGVLDNRDVLNVNETYFVGMTRGDRRSESPVWASRADSGTRLFSKPYAYVGDKSFPGGYERYVRSLTNSGELYYEVRFESCPEGAQDGRVFMGQRKDSFSIALGEIFDLVNFVPLEGSTPAAERDDLADKNVNTLALEVHRDCLVGEGNGVIGGWTTSSVRQTQTLPEEPTYRRPLRYSGPYRQVSRLGSPLVNEVVIGLPDKDRFNSSEPKEDGQFATYVTHPTLPALLDALFRGPLGAEGNIAPSNLPRLDLVTAFLTGFEGVNQLSTVTPSEMLRLNTNVAPTPKEAQVSLGVAGGDLAGFPNGRRPGDDVTDIALRVVMGALCHPIGLDLDGDGAAGGAGDNLGLCAPEDAPVGNAPLTDGVVQSAGQFLNAFPYLTTPIPGSPSGAGGGMPTEPDMMMGGGDGMAGGDDGTGGGDDGMAGGDDGMAGGDDGMGDDDDGMAGGDDGMGDDDDGMGDDDGMTGDDTDGGDDGMAGGEDGMDVAGGACPVDAGSVSADALSGTELELLWDAAAADAGVTGYDVFVDGTLFQTTDVPMIVLDGLNPGEEYFVEVVPFDADGTRFECLAAMMLTAGG